MKRRGDLFRSIFDAAPIGIEIYDSEGSLLEVNGACLEIFGVADPTELRGFRLFDDPNLHPEAKDALRSGKTFRHQIPFDFKLVHRHKLYRTTRQDLIHLDVLIAPLEDRDISGRISGYMAHIQDITERKRIEENLRAEKDFSENLIEAAQAIVLILDREGRIVRYNRYLEDLSGRPLRETRGKNWFDTFIPSDERCRITGVFNSAIGNVSTDGNVNPISTANGGLRLIQWWNRTLSTPTGESAGVVSVGIDITERRRSEEALRESSERLHDSYMRLKTATQAANVGLWDRDMLTNRFFFSREWKRQIGYEENELGDDYSEWQSRVHPEDLDGVLEAIRAHIEDANPPVYQAEYRFRHKDGSWRNILAQGSVFRDAQDRAVRMMGSHLDITERKELEARLRQAEKMNVVGQLVGGVAHDFNNQLSGVLGYAELLCNRLEDPGLKGYAENIRTAAGRSAELIRQLLAFSRKGRYVSVPVDIREVVSEVVAILERSIDKRISISLRPEADLHLVAGDPTQLQNAILNLAMNARDAMPDGGTLTFSTSQTWLPDDPRNPELKAGSYLMLRVSDTGVGMDAKTMTRIFEPFFTTKEKGTGLGLPAVLGAARNHRGMVRAESVPGKGSTFTLCLPLLSGAQAAAAAASGKTAPDGAADRESQGETAVRDGAHILVVDDETVVRRLLSDILRRLGYRVTVFEGGGEAIAYYRDCWKSVDLVLLDMIMPKIGGRELFHSLRRINPEIRALLVSGHSLEGEVQKILDDGVLGFVQKPFLKAELSRKITEALGRSGPGRT